MTESASHAVFVMNRDMQRRLLEAMRNFYPETMPIEAETTDWSSVDAIPNLEYLAEHKLCESGYTNLGRNVWLKSGARITAKGLDFLEQDGGLSAILGVVTVKFHADTIRDLLVAKVDASDLPLEKKSALRSAIRGASSMALQTASKDLITAGIHHVPGGISWVAGLFGL